MIEILMVAAVMGLVFVLLPALIAMWFIRRRARPEARPWVRRLVFAILVMGFAAAAGWAPVLQRLRAQAADGELARYCDGEVEEIYKTVSDVRGLHVRVPPGGGGGQDYHTEDNHADKFLRRPERKYDFVEYSHFGPDTSVQRHNSWQDPNQTVVANSPEARYAFTWRALTTIPEQNLGVFGDETIVFDLQTGEVLARRVLYYKVGPDDRSRGLAGPEYRTCGKVSPGANRGQVDHRARDSYAFVTRVLVPPALPAEQNFALNDLVRGAGARRKYCAGYIHIGEGLSRDDVSLRRAGEDLLISVNGTDDLLYCERFFTFGMHASGDDKVVFADDGAITYGELGRLPKEPAIPLNESLRIPSLERRDLSASATRTQPAEEEADRYDRMVDEAARRGADAAMEAQDEVAGEAPDLDAFVASLPKGTRVFMVDGDFAPTTHVVLDASAGPALAVITTMRPHAWYFRAMQPGQLKGVYFLGAGEQTIKGSPGGMPVFSGTTRNRPSLPELLRRMAERSTTPPPMASVDVEKGAAQVLLR